VRYYDIHEVPAVMYVPLAILGILSVVGGIINLPGLTTLANFLEPVFHTVPAHEIPSQIEVISIVLGIVAAVVGFALAWSRYRKGFEYKESSNPVYQFVLNKYYVDEALDVVLIRPILALGRGLTFGLENFTLDGLSRGIGWVLRACSSGLRRLQTGYMRNYALAIMLGVVLIVVYYAVRG
jgi:NADH-quinone oxidoreductase subunit L